MQRRALFLDRDGTLVQLRPYPTRTDELVLVLGVAGMLRRFQAAGWSLVMITNQSAVARGYLSESELHYLHAYMEAQLGLDGVKLDGIYYCPHHPEGVVAPFNTTCSCRKPNPGMLLQAANDLQIDTAASWFVGDSLDDVEAGRRAGCRTALVELGAVHRPGVALRTPDLVGRDTVDALAQILALEVLEPCADEAEPAREVALGAERGPRRQPRSAAMHGSCMRSL